MWPPIGETMKNSSDLGSDLPEQEQVLVLVQVLEKVGGQMKL